MTKAKSESFPIIPCRGCGVLIVRWESNTRLCKACAVESIRKSKRTWQAQWRARQKAAFLDELYRNDDASEEEQRKNATLELEDREDP